MAPPKCKRQKLIINLDDSDSEDDEGDILNLEISQSEKAALDNGPGISEASVAEHARIMAVIEQATIKIPTFTSNACRLQTSKDNCINIQAFKLKYTQEIQTPINITSKNGILLPFYKDCVAFSTIHWAMFNSNNNLNKKLKLRQLKFLREGNAAMWVCEEQGHEGRKQEWLDRVNSRTDQEPSQLFGSTVDDANLFMIMEYSYLTQATLKALCGLCVFVCKVDTTGTLKLVDLANIKLSCNTANRVYGNFINIFTKYPTAPIFMYIPQNMTSRVLLNTYLHPWSQYITAQHDRIYNLVTVIQLDPSPLATECIDQDIHYKSCACCNCLNLFAKIAANKYTTRGLVEVLNRTLVEPLNEGTTILPTYVSCGGTKFMTYGTHKSMIIDSTCKCKGFKN